jgi:anti-anti-sigma regulatory factor
MDEFTLEWVGEVLVVEPGCRVGTLAGGDITNGRQRVLNEIRHSNLQTVVFDFRNVECLGSRLIDTLCVLWKCLRERSGRLVLCRLSEDAYEVLKVSRLLSLWPVYPSREEALDAQTIECGQQSGIRATPSIVSSEAKP